MIRFSSMLAVVLSVGVSANASVSPDFFVGQYELVETRVGSCDRNLWVDQTVSAAGHVDLNVGTYSFVKINQGPQLLDDELVRLAWNAYTTASSEAIEHRELVTKPSQTKSVRRTVVKREGDRLSLKSTTRMESPNESAIEFGEECVYRKLPDPS